MTDFDFEHVAELVVDTIFLHTSKELSMEDVERILDIVRIQLEDSFK